MSVHSLYLFFHNNSVKKEKTNKVFSSWIELFNELLKFRVKFKNQNFSWSSQSAYKFGLTTWFRVMARRFFKFTVQSSARWHVNSQFKLFSILYFGIFWHLNKGCVWQKNTQAYSRDTLFLRRLDKRGTSRGKMSQKEI